MPASPLLEIDERERLQAQYAEIATLAGGLAHEIKNPLSTISMNLELLGEELEQSESPRDRRMLGRIGRVRGECARLEHVLDAFLQFARAGELKLAETDLNDVVLEFIDFYLPRAAERRIEISPHLAADLPPVTIDRSLLRQALENLTINAEQAMPDGGLLELQTSHSDGQVRLELIDSGLGMDSDTQTRIFQAFFSTRRGGSGLGLPTARKIVEAHRGTIACDSEPGRGTRFVISLPSAESLPSPEPAAT
ncbi:MAG: ATP-binding protein [Planctomycetaceae bacterium]